MCVQESQLWMCKTTELLLLSWKGLNVAAVDKVFNNAIGFWTSTYNAWPSLLSLSLYKIVNQSLLLNYLFCSNR